MRQCVFCASSDISLVYCQNPNCALPTPAVTCRACLRRLVEPSEDEDVSEEWVRAAYWGEPWCRACARECVKCRRWVPRGEGCCELFEDLDDTELLDD